MAGTITVGELLSDPTSNNKITVGSGTTLDLVNGAGSVTGAGKVLQVVVGSGASDPETATSSTSFVATGTYASISPTNASSKVLVMIQGGMLSAASGADGILFATIYRNGVDVGCPSMRVRNDSSGTARSEAPWSISFYDTPNTTGLVTYTGYIHVATSGTIQSSNHLPQSPLVTLMEIAQ
jgi:hypothetical protein